MIKDDLEVKLEALKAYIKSLGSLAVGFSGGVDSTFLLAVAREVLGDSVIAVTCEAEFIPQRESTEAKAFCRERGIRQFMYKTEVLGTDTFRKNPADRCYHCKKSIFSNLIKIASENGIKYVAEGSNMDDLGDYRPGIKAVTELKVVSPLREAGLYKDEIRELSKRMGLETWDKPAYACLASRFVYGEMITAEKLQMIDRAEDYLIKLGFVWERVRIHGNIARIEVPPADIHRITEEETRIKIYRELKKIGFQFVTLDLGGYKVGSMNSTIQ
ncbi:MAG: ATP-dependent sacrificial sulfur transferase LarE [Lachnospiraceae bacterium]|nr:ATP-dependent sacrificial sulfur transferase LarE [Lachnospiraceae bacterium]